MTTLTGMSLLGFIAWTLLLAVVIAGIRVWLTLTGKRAANSFAVDGADVSPFAGRLARAHANCYEHAPVWGGLLLIALASGLTEITNATAPVALAARLGQSITHLISTSNRAVTIRFVFYFVQLLIFIFWVGGLAYMSMDAL